MSHAFILHQFKINLKLIACFAVIVNSYFYRSALWRISLCKQRYTSYRKQTSFDFLIRPRRVPNKRGASLLGNNIGATKKNLSSWIHHFAACYTTKKFGACKSLLSPRASVRGSVSRKKGVVRHSRRKFHLLRPLSLCQLSISSFFPFFFSPATFSHPRFRLRLLFLFCERAQTYIEWRNYNTAHVVIKEFVKLRVNFPLIFLV